MPLALLIGVCAWAAIVVVVLSLCRLAARGDRALIGDGARDARYPPALAKSCVPGSAPTSRVALRAAAVGHRHTPRTRAH